MQFIIIASEIYGFIQYKNIGGYEDGVIVEQITRLGIEKRSGGGEIAPTVRFLLTGEPVPRIAVDRLGIVGVINDCEAVAGEAVPFGGR